MSSYVKLTFQFTEATCPVGKYCLSYNNNLPVLLGSTGSSNFKTHLEHETLK